MGTGYLNLTSVANDYASTPDASALDIVGDIDIRARVAMADWTPTSTQAIAAKYATNQGSWRLRLDTSGLLRFVWGVVGTTDAGSVVSTVATGVTDGAVKWVRVTLDVDNGSTQNVVRFYLSDDGATWTQLGNAVTTAGVTSIFSGTAALEVGRNGSAGAEASGKFYRAQVRSNILNDGTGIVFDADFSVFPSNVRSFRESSTSAALVTLNGTAALVSDVPAGGVSRARITNGS